jgi:hypothetical protein
VTGVAGVALNPRTTPRSCRVCEFASAGTLAKTSCFPSSLLTWARRTSNERPRY